MALSSTYVQAVGQLPEFFAKIQEGQAPERFTLQHLKDLGFTSSSHRTFVPLLKALGFLSSDGSPTERYHDFRNKARARAVMGQALKEAYSDLFLIKERPKDSDRDLIEGKFKSTHNASDRVAKLMAATFFALLPLADLDAPDVKAFVPERAAEKPTAEQPPPGSPVMPPPAAPPLHYNIQIHLPATKDIEVFNAIFKSLKEHLLE